MLLESGEILSCLMMRRLHTSKIAEDMGIEMENNCIWYIAEVVMEVTVGSDPRNVVHHNHFLITANSNEEAYEKATAIGKREETSYKNPAGHDVSIRFVGIADLDEVDDEPGDGAEVLFHYRLNVPKKELESLIPEKSRLRAFAPKSRASGPDYASGEVIELVRMTTGIKRPG